MAGHASALLAPIQAAGGANGGNILTDWAAGVATPPLVGTRLVRDLPANPLNVFAVLAPVPATADDWVSTLAGAHFTTPAQAFAAGVPPQGDRAQAVAAANFADYAADHTVSRALARAARGRTSVPLREHPGARSDPIH